MGYNTKFEGVVKLSRKLTFSEAAFILEANEDPDLITGEHPRSYMQWVPSETLDSILYDGNEKFYDYVEWMEWICEHLRKIDVVANGTIYWIGEDSTDTGKIEVNDSLVTSFKNDEKTVVSGKPLTLSKLQSLALDFVRQSHGAKDE